MGKKIFFDNTEDWHEYRKDKITASKIAAAAGLSPWTSQRELFEIMTNRIPPIETTYPMKVGIYAENFILDLWADEEKATLLRDRSRIMMYEHDTLPYLAVSPDEIAYVDGVECLVEVKATRMIYTKETIPVQYLSQIQMQLGISGYKRCIFLFFSFPLAKHVAIPIDFDEDYYNILIEAAIEFKALLDSDTYPDYSVKRDFDKIKVSEAEVICDETTFLAYLKLCELDATLKETKEEIDRHKLMLIRRMRNKTFLKWDEHTIATYRNNKSGGRTLKVNYNKNKEI